MRDNFSKQQLKCTYGRKEIRYGDGRGVGVGKGEPNSKCPAIRLEGKVEQWKYPSTDILVSLSRDLLRKIAAERQVRGE